MGDSEKPLVSQGDLQGLRYAEMELAIGHGRDLPSLQMRIEGRRTTDSRYEKSILPRITLTDHVR
jgi:hypothetical protein